MINPGTVLGERYEVQALIGTGGMANVYRAMDQKLNREVAIKVLKEEYSSNKNFVSKFKAEAQAAAGLMHPNIVNVYDVGDENGLYYFVMELVDGITLKHYIEKKIRLSVKEAVSIAIQVSMGIEAAHNKGIIHRDIKPQNIIISRDGKVKVADFGIARAATSDTITTHAMGSVHYTSPEQARGGYSDAKSDIYSIGITLFEMVTGRVPFDGETTVSIAIKHIQEEMPSPRIYVQDIPVSVEQIIFKCTQKNPDRRYLNISSLITDLKKSLINPDENFVVIQDAASNAGTRTITEKDRQEIRRTVDSEPAGAPPVREQEESYRDQMYENRGYGQRAVRDPYREEQPPIQQPVQQNPVPEQGRQQAPYPNQPYPPYMGQAPVYPGQQQPEMQQMNPVYQQAPMGPQGQPVSMGPQGQPVSMGPQGQPAMAADPMQQQMYGGVEIPGLPEMEDEAEDEELIDFLFTPNLNMNGQRNKQTVPEPEPEEKPGRGRKEKKKKQKEPKEPKEPKQRDRKKSRDDAYMTDSDSGDVDPKMERVMSVLLIVAAIVVALVAVFAVGRALGLFSLTSSSQLEEGMVETPSVVGMTLDEASVVLREAGLTATATYRESTAYDKDYISEQTPAAGEAMEEGGVMTLVVSSGKVAAQTDEVSATTENVRMATIPNVVGLMKAEARVALENEEFTVVEEETEDENAEINTVVRQSPEGETDAPAGSAVTVYICTGKPAKEVTVPDIVGKDEASAKSLLDEAGLTYANVNEEINETVAKGVVLTQSVAAGTTVNEGDNVDFTISKGPTTYSCNFSITAPADYLAGTEAIIVLVNAAGVEIGRYTTSSFPYNLVQTGIAGSDAGLMTVTYMTLEAQWNTTAPVAVTFTREQ
ncbi:MAG: protein kinase [Lachnospiraceae bacterium]|nr:protein kinase [Lachnospiraceae bacterium]